MTEDTKSSIKIWAFSFALAVPCALGIMYFACWIANQLALGITGLIF